MLALPTTISRSKQGGKRRGRGISVGGEGGASRRRRRRADRAERPNVNGLTHEEVGVGEEGRRGKGGSEIFGKHKKVLSSLLYFPFTGFLLFVSPSSPVLAPLLCRLHGSFPPSLLLITPPPPFLFLFSLSARSSRHKDGKAKGTLSLLSQNFFSHLFDAAAES